MRIRLDYQFYNQILVPLNAQESVSLECILWSLDLSVCRRLSSMWLTVMNVDTESICGLPSSNNLRPISHLPNYDTARYADPRAIPTISRISLVRLYKMEHSSHTRSFPSYAAAAASGFDVYKRKALLDPALFELIVNQYVTKGQASGECSKDYTSMRAKDLERTNSFPQKKQKIALQKHPFLRSGYKALQETDRDRQVLYKAALEAIPTAINGELMF